MASAAIESFQMQGVMLSINAAVLAGAAQNQPSPKSMANVEVVWRRNIPDLTRASVMGESDWRRTGHNT